MAVISRAGQFEAPEVRVLDVLEQARRAPIREVVRPGNHGIAPIHIEDRNDVLRQVDQISLCGSVVIEDQDTEIAV
ncbi:MAG: hypothetical protein K9L88_07615 [Chromatiaceae bacterium]|nr:hypothetical protein [Chromatiaceae bacterium]